MNEPWSIVVLEALAFSGVDVAGLWERLPHRDMVLELCGIRNFGNYFLETFLAPIEDCVKIHCTNSKRSD